MSDAVTTLLSSTEEEPLDSDDGVTIIRLTSGRPHTWAIYSAVLDRYAEITGRHRPTEDDLEQLLGEKVTLVKHGENMIGGGLLIAQEGTLTYGTNGRMMILPKRARRKGFGVDPNNLLDVFPGYATAKAQELVNEVRAHFPKIKPITQERLEELPERLPDGGQLELCVFGTHRLPDSSQSDALVLYGSYIREDDILDQGVVLVRPEHGVSEHGSMYGRQMLQGHFGEVVGYKPISFSEAIHLCDVDFDEAYARLVP